MSLEIAFVGLNRERACRGSKASATYAFTVSDGPAKTRAEVILIDGGFEIIEHSGLDVRTAARIALQQFLVSVRNPFESPVFLRVPFRQAEYFVKHGIFHKSLC
jgi:hypothetical protein